MRVPSLKGLARWGPLGLLALRRLALLAENHGDGERRIKRRGPWWR